MSQDAEDEMAQKIQTHPTWASVGAGRPGPDYKENTRPPPKTRDRIHGTTSQLISSETRLPHSLPRLCHRRHSVFCLLSSDS